MRSAAEWITPLLNVAARALAVGAWGGVVFASLGPSLATARLVAGVTVVTLFVAKYVQLQQVARAVSLLIGAAVLAGSDVLIRGTLTLAGSWLLPRSVVIGALAVPMMLGLLAIAAPSGASARGWRGSLVASGALLIGAWVPHPAWASLGVAACAGAGLALAPPAGPSIPTAADVPTPSVVEDTLRAASLAALMSLAALSLMVWSPGVDPSPGAVVIFVAGIVAGLGAFARPLVRSGVGAVLCVASLAAVLALALPHTVGIQRVFLANTLPWAVEDVTALSLGFIAVAGASIGALSGAVRPVHPSWVTAGLTVGLLAAGGELTGGREQTALWVAGVGAAVCVLLTPSRPAQAGGVAIAGLLAVAIYRDASLPIDLLAVTPVTSLRSDDDWQAHLDRSVDLAPGSARLSDGASGVVLAPPESWSTIGAQGVPRPFETSIAGHIVRPIGRATDAEVLAGSLAGLLSPRLDRVLVLGDDAGNVLLGLSPHEPTAVDIAAPVPEVIQDIAQLDNSRKSRWLAPGVRLWPDHPDRVLRMAPEPAAVVEVLHAPWPDAAHTAASPLHLAAVADRLGDFGVYVACVHLSTFASGEPQALAARLADTFDHVQLWLPPTGADSLLLVASQRALPLSRLEERATSVLTDLRTLGFPNAAALASSAVGDRTAIDAWRSSTPASPPRLSAWRIGPATRLPRRVHLASLASHVAPPDRTWDLDSARTSVAELAGRVDTRRRFLSVLSDAERGDVRAAFAKARSIVDDGGDEAARALKALVGPHLANAQKALEQAVEEGPSSKAWEDVQRYATTARMIAPTSAAPLVILGDVAYYQGNLREAKERFSEAARLAPGDLDALSGLGRVARARRDMVAAEQHLRDAATANPRRWEAWQRLGVLLLEQGRTDEARTTLERAQSLAEGRHPAPSIALAELHLAEGHPTSALVHAERAIVVGPTGYGYFLRGLSYEALEQYEKAENDFRRAVLEEPRLAQAHGEIGRIRAMQGDRAAAEEAWKMVLRIAPNNTEARENLRLLGIEERSEGSDPSEAP